MILPSVFGNCQHRNTHCFHGPCKFCIVSRRKAYAREIRTSSRINFPILPSNRVQQSNNDLRHVPLFNPPPTHILPRILPRISQSQRDFRNFVERYRAENQINNGINNSNINSNNILRRYNIPPIRNTTRLWPFRSSIRYQVYPNSNPRETPFFPNLSGAVPRPVSQRTLIRTTNIVKPEVSGECCICLDKFTNECRELPCKHRFHVSCIDRWFKSNRKCPICRYEIN